MYIIYTKYIPTTPATLQLISNRTAASYVTIILKDLRYLVTSDSLVLADNASDDSYNDNDNGNSSGSSNNNKGSNKTKL